MKITERVKSWFGIGAEGSHRGPFSALGEFGGVFQLGPIEDGFQRNLELPDRGRHIPAAYAAVMANARAASQCSPIHYRTNNGANEPITTSAISRKFRSPNSYQTWPQWLTDTIAAMQFDGEAFALLTRNNRYEVDSMHLMPSRSCSPYVSATGEIFYSIGTNPMLPNVAAGDMMAPARDIIHFRQYCPRHPLMGESPIKAAALAANVNVSLSMSQAAFFSRMNRPSGVLATDSVLSAQQMQQLRAAFDEQSKAWAQGGLPILSNGLKFMPMSVSSQDAQLIQAQRLSIEDIARVYGVPLPVIGDLTHATLSNVEQLISMWLSISLGALLDNIERSLEKAFDLPPNEFVQLDPSPLLRTDFLGRIDGLTKAIQGGLMTPNEARVREGLSPVGEGDKPYMQQQMVPMGWTPQQDVKPEQKPEVEVKPADIEQPEKSIDAEISKALVVELFNRKKSA